MEDMSTRCHSDFRLHTTTARLDLLLNARRHPLGQANRIGYDAPRTLQQRVWILRTAFDKLIEQLEEPEKTQLELEQNGQEMPPAQDR